MTNAPFGTAHRLSLFRSGQQAGRRKALPDGVRPSLLQYYQMIYTASAIIAVLGVVAAVFGGRLLAKRGIPQPSLSQQQDSPNF